MKLVEAILNEMKNISKPQKKFFILLMKTIVSMHGHVTFSGLSRYSCASEKLFRRWFKRSFDFIEFNSRAIDRVIETGAEVIGVFDQSFISKSGKQTYGRGTFWNGSDSRAEKGLELGVCALVDVNKKTAYTLLAKQTPPDGEIKKNGIDSNTQLTRIDSYLDVIKAACATLHRYTKTLVFDGYFAKKKFVDGIVAMGFTFIGKLRSDANLWMFYSGKQRKGRGRPKKFAGKCNLKNLEGFDYAFSAIDDEGNIDQIHQGIFHQPSLDIPAKVVAIVAKHGNRVGVALLFSTNLSLSAEAIVRYYKARFQIEFLFRDAKQFAGLCDCQSRSKSSLYFHQNAAMSGLNLMKIQVQKDEPNRPIGTPFSAASCKIKNYNKTLIDRFFSMLGFDLNLIKYSTAYCECVEYGVVKWVRS